MSKAKDSKSNTRAAQEQLRALRDRIIRLEEEKKQIADDIKDVYAEAKSAGFDPKSLRQVVRRAKETPSQAAARRETEAITDLYLANLGMLDGTPLGDAARERMLPEEGRRDEEVARARGKGEHGEDEASATPPVRPTISAEDIQAAREQGATDARDGKRIIDNPFTAGDPRRAAWDEGHCQERGSDGMDIPDSWKRKPKDENGAGE